MKKWLVILLALTFVFAGCGKKDEAKGDDNEKAQTQSKDGKNKQTGKEKAKVASIQDIDKNRYHLVLFLNRAEHVFEDLQFAAASNPKGKTVTIDGITYRQLPANVDTKEKIITYFSRFWSRPLAVRMYDNLHTKDIKGKIYLAEGDGIYSMLITNKNISSKKDANGITAIVREAATPLNSANYTVTYRISKDKKNSLYKIRERTGTYGQKMFK